MTPIVDSTISVLPEVKQARYRAGILLEQVLDEVITPRQALNRWPTLPGMITDASLDSSYQALWHFESDEEQQKTIVYYLDAQLELLKQLSRILQQGKAIPLYLERPYPKAMRVKYYQSQFNFMAVWTGLKVFFQKVGEILSHLIEKELFEKPTQPILLEKPSNFSQNHSIVSRNQKFF